MSEKDVALAVLRAVHPDQVLRIIAEQGYRLVPVPVEPMCRFCGKRIVASQDGWRDPDTPFTGHAWVSFICPENPEGNHPHEPRLNTECPICRGRDGEHHRRCEFFLPVSAESPAEELARLEAEFAAAGGRGVDLAERIDQLRAQVDVRHVSGCPACGYPGYKPPRCNECGILFPNQDDVRAVSGEFTHEEAPLVAQLAGEVERLRAFAREVAFTDADDVPGYLRVKAEEVLGDE